MSRRPRQREGANAIDLVDEAVHLLRTAPASLLATYFLGSAPFVLGFLYFWAEMSRGAYAYRHCAAAALGVALLYLWMKFWQAVFAQQLLALRAGQAPPRWDWQRILRVVMTQTVIQPTMFLLLPLASLVMLPFGWVYAFYHNLSVLSDGTETNIRGAVSRSWQQTGTWAQQNHLVLTLLLLFGTFVFVNIYAAVLFLPTLVKMLFGIESVFTRSFEAYLNTTVFAAVCGLTYLCVNPVIKAVYVLRCFYGESRRTGADLRAELKALPLAVLLLGFFLAGNLSAAPVTSTPAATPAPGIESAQLDRAMDRVLTQSEYTWRMPREKPPLEERGVIGQFFDTTLRMLRNWKNAIQDWIDRVSDWFRKLFRSNRSPDHDDTTTDWTARLHFFVFILVAIAAVILGILLWRIWRNRRRTPLVVASAGVAAPPDLRDESVLADQLPTEGWLEQAAALMAQGDLRLALRALFLANLSHLATRELIAIARFKSNRDYQRELHRRAHTLPVLITAFGDNVTAFERAWYGMHEVTPAALDEFTANLKRIREVA